MRSPARLVVAVVLLAAPAIWIAAQALADPRIAFLVPSPGACWVRHPKHDVVSPETGTAVFRRVFEAPGEPQPLRLRAFGEPSVSINGHEVLPIVPVSSWKEARAYDLRPHLVGGRNRLEVRVSNRRGVPVLQVTAPKETETCSGWVVASGSAPSDEVPVSPPLFRPPRPGPLQRWAGWTWARWLAGAWLACSVGVVAVSLLRREPGAAKPRPRVPPPRALSIGVPLAILAVSLALNLANAARYPYSRTSLDWWGHVEYVERMADSWSVPTASDGWETFQPPLYYAIAGAVYELAGGEEDPERGLKAVQVLGCVFAASLVLLAWLYARFHFPDDPPTQWLAVGFAGLLPMSILTAPLVSNEAFSATLVAMALYVFLRWVRDPPPTLSRAVWAGAVAGAAMLSKYTGVLAVAAGAGAAAVRAGARRSARELAMLGVCLAVALLAAGWLYGRNAMLFGDPFVGNWDAASGHAYVQEPSFRTAAFYTTFGKVFLQHPTRSLWTSWLDGNYATLWADSHSSFFAQDDDGAFFWMQVLMLLAALPTAAIAAGFLLSLASVLRRPTGNPDLVLVAASVAIWTAIVSFSLEVPAYSSIKAFFFLGLSPTLAVYLGRGRQRLDAALPWGRRLLDLTAAVIAGLVLYLYRFPG